MELWYALVDALPFEWAEPGRMLFMKNALLAILVISPLCGLTAPMGAAVIFALCFSLLFTWVRHKTSLASDTVIGVFSSTAVALGIFAATLGGGSFTKFNALLIGDILSVEPGMIALLLGILALILALWVCCYNDLLLSALHPALADSRGIRVFWQEAVLNAAIAVVVTLSMTWVGLLVINSLLVLPGAAARNLARNTRQYHLFSVLGAVVCGVGGLMCSYYWGASAGAAVTLCLALYFFLSLLSAPKRR